jgi:hypothetical protein
MSDTATDVTLAVEAEEETAPEGWEPWDAKDALVRHGKEQLWRYYDGDGVDYDALVNEAAAEYGWNDAQTTALLHDPVVLHAVLDALISYVTSGRQAYDAYAGTLERG